jgi:DNA-directed RNA polymerase subunit K/omega
MVDFKKSKASLTTITRDMEKLDERTGNIYETVMICAKRANQISVEFKQ